MSKIMIEKAVAYITWSNRLLVFIHTDFPEAGIQVPAGTIKPGETPTQAVLREAEEETGLQGLKIKAYLGSLEVDQAAWGLDAIHRRHFFHLIYSGEAPERWNHFELDPSDGSPAPIKFELYWVSLATEAPNLIAEMGALLPELRI